MARKVVSLVLVFALGGCAASIQPIQSMSSTEIKAALTQLQQNDRLLAEKIAEIAPKPKKK